MSQNLKGDHFESMNRRRQQKMHENENNFESRRILPEIGPGRGLIFSGIEALWTY